ncbi:MAG: hypothetical protein BMS9Abin31_1055 [Gammaproteobacteria bacterium]|nr:MAG: hypothetical protein BMS9Abin31_1055 [Gammaproteobacteria bacterium]
MMIVICVTDFIFYVPGVYHYQKSGINIYAGYADFIADNFELTIAF